MTEINELKKKIKALEKENERLNSAFEETTFLKKILELTPEHIYWKDLDSTYRGCNDEFAKMFGYSSRHDVVGKSEYSLNNGINAKSVISQDSKVIKQKETICTEEVAYDSKGNKRIFLSRKAPVLNSKNEAIGLVGISFDITAQKALEQMKTKAETLRILAASMAHELRTPLRAINMAAKGVENELAVLLDTYQLAKDNGLDVPRIEPVKLPLLKKALQNIQSAQKSSQEIVDMLVFKSGLSDIDTSNFKTCSIASCVETALNSYSLTDEQRKLITWKHGDFQFHGSEALFSHVLFNLLKNALYYVKAAGKGEITIWAIKGADRNELHFKDTGQGIPDEVLARIFDPFFTTLSHGTGVGLAFSKLVMQSLGGEIDCTSKVGEYTEFTMHFPKD